MIHNTICLHLSVQPSMDQTLTRTDCWLSIMQKFSGRDSVSMSLQAQSHLRMFLHIGRILICCHGALEVPHLSASISPFVPWLKSPSLESVTLALAEQRSFSFRNLMLATRCLLHCRLQIGSAARGWAAVFTPWTFIASRKVHQCSDTLDKRHSKNLTPPAEGQAPRFA